MNSEAKFADARERLSAMAAYYGLCSYLDHNVGQIMAALDQAGLTENTTIIYSSDHGDNVGARGLWGKSNMYQESVAIPMIMAGPEIAHGTCETPASLLDISATIAEHFGAPIDGADGIAPLPKIASAAPDPDRVVFSEYHAAGSVSGAFMLRKGRWKLIHYVGFEDELFDLETDPEELCNVAPLPENAATLADLHKELRRICDPLTANDQAFVDQAALIERHGGFDAAMKLGAPGATPPPDTGPNP